MLAVGMGGVPGGPARRRPGRRSRRRRWCCSRRSPLQLWTCRCSCRWRRSSASRCCARGFGPGAADGRPRSPGRPRAGLAVAVRAPPRPRRRPRPRRWSRITSARWRRWRRSETWRWCRWSSWASSRSASPARSRARSGRRSAPLPLAAAGAGGARARWRSRTASACHAPLWLCRTPNALRDGGPHRRPGAWRCVARRGARTGRARAAAAAALAAARWRRQPGGARLARRHARDLAVTFLDVGQGDAAVVEAPGGAVMLVDGGGARDGAFDPGARIVEPFLRARGIGRVDVVALSHPHPDHLNGLFRIAGAVRRSARCGRAATTATTRSTAGCSRSPRRAVSRRRRSRRRALGGASIEPLGPLSGSHGGRTHRRARGVDGQRRLAGAAGRVSRAAGVLFAGDLEADGEGELVGRRDAGQTVAADVLKVPHHGSRTSSSPELVEAVAPALAVMSLGWRNQFRFPAPEVRGALPGPRRARAAHRPGRRDHGDDLARRRRSRCAASAAAPRRNRRAAAADDPTCHLPKRIRLPPAARDVDGGPARGACATAAGGCTPRAVELQAAGVEALGRGELDRAAGHFALALEYEPRLARGGERARPGGACAAGTGPAPRSGFARRWRCNEELAEAHANLAARAAAPRRAGRGARSRRAPRWPSIRATPTRG